MTDDVCECGCQGDTRPRMDYEEEALGMLAELEAAGQVPPSVAYMQEQFLRNYRPTPPLVARMLLDSIERERRSGDSP